MSLKLYVCLCVFTLHQKLFNWIDLYFSMWFRLLAYTQKRDLEYPFRCTRTLHSVWQYPIHHIHKYTFLSYWRSEKNEKEPPIWYICVHLPANMKIKHVLLDRFIPLLYRLHRFASHPNANFSLPLFVFIHSLSFHIHPLFYHHYICDILYEWSGKAYHIQNTVSQANVRIRWNKTIHRYRLKYQSIVITSWETVYYDCFFIWRYFSMRSDINQGYFIWRIVSGEEHGTIQKLQQQQQRTRQQQKHIRMYNFASFSIYLSFSWEITNHFLNALVHIFIFFSLFLASSRLVTHLPRSLRFHRLFTFSR